MLDTIAYIRLNLKQELTVQSLAARAMQHPDHFSRQFLAATGIRPTTYIHEKRIERAQYLITTTDMGFEEIANSTGFESLSYFSKIFKKVTGQTPGNYRKLHLEF